MIRIWLLDPTTTRVSAFSVLPSLPDEHLLKVTADCHIDLNVTEGSPAETLSLIRATELEQAELAQTRVAIATKQEEDRMFEAREKEARELAAASAGADLQLALALDKRGGPSTSMVRSKQVEPCAGPVTRRHANKQASPANRKPYTRQARVKKGGS